MTSLLSIESVSKSYDKGVRVLNDVNLEVQHGEFIAVLGPSGCGKTTLLAILAGFVAPDSGRVCIEGQDITALPAYKRPLNTVFQSYALFPHMTVLANVAYGPLRAGASKSDARDKALEALEMVGLANLAQRYPEDMSGGQRQRVALARAIVNKPQLLLLDEPLSALDMKLRKHMQRELKALQEQLGISFLFVTHDQEEALAMADRIVVMNQGNIEQIGTGDEIYHQPQNRFVADFIGEANLLACEIKGDDIWLSCSETIIGKRSELDSHDPRLAMYRPESLAIGPPGSAGVQATIHERISTGSMTSYYLALNDETVVVRIMGADATDALGKGDQVTVHFPDTVHFVKA